MSLPQSQRPLYYVNERPDLRFHKPWCVQMRIAGRKALTIARYPNAEAAERHADILNRAREQSRTAEGVDA